MIVKDTLLVTLSDLHSGSSAALMPDREFQFKYTNVKPKKKQRELYRHFVFCAEWVRQNRKNRRVIVVHNGDAIEGVHHNTQELITYNTDEQADVHIELMDYFLNKIQFNKKNGDRLFYTSGTEVHVHDKEDKIAKYLPAESNKDGERVFNELKMPINGREVWFLHHGPKRGAGTNEGNALRLWLGCVYWQCLKTNKPFPDLIVTGHTHTPCYNTYVQDYHVIHGVICPSWQSKTRHVYNKNPVDRNEVGILPLVIQAGGEIKPPVPLLKETQEFESVKI